MRDLFRPGIESLKRCWIPFLILQTLTVALLVFYRQDEAVRTTCRSLAAFKASGGLLLSALSTALAGAVLPEIARTVAGERGWDSERRSRVFYNMVVFAGSGFIVDLQMRLLNAVVGSDVSFRTAVTKSLLDQFVLAMVYGNPYLVLMIGFREHGYRFRPLLRTVGLQWYLGRVLPLSVAAWAYWVPMTIVIYSLPADLQFCMFVPVMGAWSLIMLLIIAHTASRTQAEPIKRMEPVKA